MLVEDFVQSRTVLKILGNCVQFRQTTTTKASWDSHTGGVSPKEKKKDNKSTTNKQITSKQQPTTTTPTKLEEASIFSSTWTWMIFARAVLCPCNYHTVIV